MDPIKVLSALLSQVRFVAMVHQMNHWNVQGAYDEHLLYERLYDETEGDIDALAEKILGLGGGKLSLTEHMQSMLAFSNKLPVCSEIEKSLVVEESLGRTLTEVLKSLEAADVLTKGLDNLLAGMLDKSESRQYLLRQHFQKPSAVNVLQKFFHN